ncbi:MAG TPA: acetylornithine/succinylornithine family transaminase [Tepidisphaeraceae bacterium]|jgi:predicted acetylornithine/succinylornithine family transaminase|nr:acetylornithine/succinylornithine family transaminase [Tepidisphaeraceae bacterium]
MTTPNLSNQQWVSRGQQSLIQNYARNPITMVRGEGSYVWDADGKRYLDLFAGFGGGILGHCHPELVAAATEQAKTLWHVGNSFYSPPQIELAERLRAHAFPGQAFFCHSGAEANEAACKLSRLRGSSRNPHRWKIISLTHSFHGRTLAMIAATGNPAVRQGFEPDVPGFFQVEAGDFDALENAVDEQTGGILLEPIQGEGGINFYPEGYIQKVRQLCDEKGLTLIFDEVWTGCGRTGKWFGHQHYLDANGKPIEPDIMTLGKAIGGGLPVGVMYAKPQIAALFTPGKHGCTLGGNAICTAVARTIFDVIARDNLTDHAAALGELSIARLKNESSIKQKIADVRGKGLFLGIELKDPPEKFAEKSLARGIIVNLTAKKVIRLAPPINIDEALWHKGLDEVVQLIASFP